METSSSAWSISNNSIIPLTFKKQTGVSPVLDMSTCNKLHTLKKNTIFTYALSLTLAFIIHLLQTSHFSQNVILSIYS